MIEGLQPYSEYRNPSLPWLDAIPSHWEMIPNRALMKDQRQVVGERASDYTLLSLTLQGVIARDMVNPKGKFPAQFDTYKVVRPNDMIFCLFDIDETPRGVGLSHQSGMITGAYDVFTPTSRVDPRFLNHYYRFVDDGKLMKPLYTGLRKTIQHGTFAGLKTPCPPPDEQAAIVRFLDHANRKIDGFIRAKRKLIGLLNEQKQAIIHRAVTRGLNPNAPLKPSGIPWLGDIPRHWDTMRLKNACKIRGGFAFKTEWFRPAGVPVIRMSNLRRGTLDLTEAVRISENDCVAGFELKAGDILYGLSGSVGATGSLGNFAQVATGDLPAQLNQRVARFRTDMCVLSVRFLVFLIQTSIFYDQVLADTTGTAQFNVSTNDVGKVTFSLPSVTEQTAICDWLDESLAQPNALITRTEREIALMQEYRTRLTADVVTGKLDVREAAAKLPDLAETPADSAVFDTDDSAEPEDQE